MRFSQSNTMNVFFSVQFSATTTSDMVSHTIQLLAVLTYFYFTKTSLNNIEYRVIAKVSSSAFRFDC